MVDEISANRPLDAASRVFHALADPTRRSLLERLARGGALGGVTVGGLAEPFTMSLQAVSKHLKVLERAGLVKRDVRGRVHRCSLSAEPLAEVATWIERYRPFWENQLDALDKYVAEVESAERSTNSANESANTANGES